MGEAGVNPALTSSGESFIDKPECPFGDSTDAVDGRSCDFAQDDENSSVYW